MSQTLTQRSTRIFLRTTSSSLTHHCSQKMAWSKFFFFYAFQLPEMCWQSVYLFSTMCSVKKRCSTLARGGDEVVGGKVSERGKKGMHDDICYSKFKFEECAHLSCFYLLYLINGYMTFLFLVKGLLLIICEVYTISIHLHFMVLVFLCWREWKNAYTLDKQFVETQLMKKKWE